MKQHPLNKPAAAGRWLFALLLALLISGCGDSREDYVYTGNPPLPTQTGSLTYNFVTAQGTFDAPDGTNSIRFQLYTGANGTGELALTVTRPFSSSVTLTDVPATVQSTVLTFYTSAGLPVLETVVASPVAAGRNVVVNFTGAASEVPEFESLTATPAALNLSLNQTANVSVVAQFSNGDAVSLTGNTAAGLVYNATPAGVVSVSASGTVTPLSAGNATITVSLDANDETRSDTISVQVGASMAGPLDRIEVAPPTFTLLLNESVTLAVSGFDADNNPVALDSDDYVVSSSNTTVGVIIDGEEILGVALGNTTITVSAAADNTISDTAMITVADGSDSDFEDFALGSVNGQDGWSVSNTSIDQAIVAVTRSGAAFADFGGQALRLSDAVGTNVFDQQLVAPRLSVPVGETEATPGTNPRNNRFEASFDFTTTSETEQVGLQTEVSPYGGPAERMTFLLLEDRPDGLAVVTTEYTRDTVNSADVFTSVDVATGLSRTAPHKVRISVTTVDGDSNDVVQVYVDGALGHTGGSWEEYYRFSSEQSGDPFPALIDTLIFRIRQSHQTPTNQGGGFLFNNVRLVSTRVAP